SDLAPDDGEWGGEAPARQAGAAQDDGAEAADLARSHESLTDFLHRQALALRLSDLDRAALHFLIESLTDDGYLLEPLPELAAGLAGADPAGPVDEQVQAQIDELVHHFT